MNCPGCNKNLALTLSVCPSCGTMVKDSVREELAPRISPLAKPKIPIQESRIVKEKQTQEKSCEPIRFNSPIESVQPPIAAERPLLTMQTTEINAKSTAPILVEFQNRNAVLPEWRLQLQNSVRRRTGAAQTETPITYQKILVTNGATALKAEPVIETETEVYADSRLENALKRIEESRQKYLSEEKPKLSVVQKQPKSFPYAVPNKPPEFSPVGNKVPDEFNSAAKPKSPISSNVSKFEKFDTNKLPPIPAKVASSFEKAIEIPARDTKIPERKNNLLEIKADNTPDVVAYQESPTAAVTEISEDEGGDDRAPMISRFNAGFFDLIIGAFLSVILLAPFSLANGSLFTFQGLLAFLATCSIVMFIYLTTTIGTMGRTLGMRLFSLELVDIEENAYPTFHQAAVSSSVYLVSLALGGVGFLTLLLNDEKRAAHDLISGTIVVKEYE